MTMQKVAWPRMMVRVENGMSMMPKAERSDMPVMTPGRAMGRMISRLIWSRPKKVARAIEPLGRQAGGREGGGAFLGGEGVQEDQQDRQMQEQQPADGRQPQGP